MTHRSNLISIVVNKSYYYYYYYYYYYKLEPTSSIMRERKPSRMILKRTVLACSGGLQTKENYRWGLGGGGGQGLPTSQNMVSGLKLAFSYTTSWDRFVVYNCKFLIFFKI